MDPLKPSGIFEQNLLIWNRVWQSRADIEPNLSLSQNTPIITFIHGYVYGDASIELQSLNYDLSSKQHSLPTWILQHTSQQMFL